MSKLELRKAWVSCTPVPWPCCYGGNGEALCLIKCMSSLKQMQSSCSAISTALSASILMQMAVISVRSLPIYSPFCGSPDKCNRATILNVMMNDFQFWSLHSLEATHENQSKHTQIFWTGAQTCSLAIFQLCCRTCIRSAYSRPYCGKTMKHATDQQC